MGGDGERICRVRPDVPAVEREFDYAVPETMAERVRVGTVVRVPLHGRSVRGWVTADGIEPEAPESRLLPLRRVVGAGPPPDVIRLCRWAAWRWAGSEVALLRSATPPNAVRDPGPIVARRDGGPSPVADPVPGTALEATGGAAPTTERGGSSETTAPAMRAKEREAGSGEGDGFGVRLLSWPPAADRRELVSSLVAVGGSTIVVVPEGARLGSLLAHLARAGHRVLVQRADQPAAERANHWARARAGGCVVVGSRLAVWAPVPDLAAVVVLDEGDDALREERAPTWNARDVAVERARRCGAALTLVGPVPSLEAEAVAGPPEVPARAEERSGWPLTVVADRRDDPPGTGLLGEALAREAHRSLDAGRRVVCVLNRKGRSRLLVCAACDSVARCEVCGRAVVESGAGLSCPSCGATRPPVCTECHRSRFKRLRPGVARLADDLEALLPRASVAQVDASVADVPSVDVLVGTEAVLHRLPPGPPPGLVAYLDLDQELLAPRYRAGEQALWLLVRGARLLGGRSRGGRLLVQTRMPDHPVVVSARTGDPRVAMDAEREARRALGYPPFGALALLSGPEPAVGVACAALTGVAGVEVLGPNPDASGARALVRARGVDALADALVPAGRAGRAEGRLRVEVDPRRA